jgi:hypothetical protein
VEQAGIDEMEIRARRQHDRDHVPGLDTQRCEAGRDAADALGVIAPCELAVDTEVP